MAALRRNASPQSGVSAARAEKISRRAKSGRRAASQEMRAVLRSCTPTFHSFTLSTMKRLLFHHPFPGCATVLGLFMISALPLAAEVGVFRSHGYGPARTLPARALEDNSVFLAGDVDGDGLDDIISAAPGAGTGVRVHRNTVGSFDAPVTSSAVVQVYPGEVPLMGDFNGDGKDDLAVFTRGTVGDVYVHLGKADSTFEGPVRWHDYFCLGSEVPVVADFNGDGRDDIATFTRGATADVYGALSTGFIFSGTGLLWHADFCPGDAVPAAGDADGDGRADLIAFLRSTQPGDAVGDVMVARRTADGGFTASEKWHDFFGIGNEPPLVADFNADGGADLLTFAGDFRVYGALSRSFDFTGTGFQVHPEFRGDGGAPPAPADTAYLAGRFNGDLNTDIIRMEKYTLAGTTYYTPVLSLYGAHADVQVRDDVSMTADFGFGTLGVNPGGSFVHPPLAERPATETIPLLVLLLAAPPDAGLGRTAFAFPQSYYDSMTFGPAQPNIRSWFREMSGGRFDFSRAGITSVVSVSAAGGNPAFAAALATIDLRAAGLDPDGNGIVENNEAAILVYDNYSENLAATRPFDIPGIPQPGGRPSIRVRLNFGLAGHRSAIQNPAHELCHCLGFSWDVYNTSCFGQGYNLMGCTAGNVPPLLWHIDPWFKLRLGWLRPRVAEISRFPGMAVIDPPQRAALSSYRPPVLLYDRSRGTKEFFTLDYRDSRAAGSTFAAGSPGGYDRDVPVPGVKVWYTRTTPTHALDQITNAIIFPGPNGVLDTPANPATDDYAASGVIYPGRNGVVDTLPLSDDMLTWNNTLFPTWRAWDYPSRDGAGLILDGTSTRQGVVEWLDGTNANADLLMDRDDVRLTGIVQWGPNFTSWIEEAPGPLQAGAQHSLYGAMGARRPDSDPLLVSLTAKEPFSAPVYRSVTLSQGSTATFRVPRLQPSGSYRLQLDVGTFLASNAWEVTITNPYIDWLADHFDQLRILTWLEVRPDRDPDGDGFCNALEFEAGSNPRDPASRPAHPFGTLQPDGFHLDWSSIRTQPGLYRIIPEMSTNLTTWTSVSGVTSSSFLGLTSWTAIQPIAPGTNRLFMRLRVVDDSDLP